MTVFPEELVPPVTHTSQKVQLRSFDGNLREVGTACVSLRFGKVEWKGEVALMKSKDLNGRGLLAVNVKDKMAWV